MLNKYLFGVVNLMLIAALVFFAVDMGYQFLASALTQAAPEDPAALTADVPKPAAATLSTQTRQFSAYQTIVSRDLFKTKEAPKPAKSEEIDLQKLQQTSLKLKLLGTITGSTDNPYAVIEDSQSRNQGLYHIGEEVAGAQIKAIFRKEIVLVVAGKDEKLTMEEDDGKGPKGKMFVPAGGPDDFDPAELPPEPEVDEAVNIDREKINDSLRNINQLMSQVKVRPHFRDGRPDGLLLSHVQQNSIFNEMGLKNGDIIKGVNGKEIQSVDDALKFYDNLKSSTAVEIQIERQGDTMTIGYQIQE